MKVSLSCRLISDSDMSIGLYFLFLHVWISEVQFQLRYKSMEFDGK